MALDKEQKDEARENLKELLDEGTNLPIAKEGDLPSFNDVERYSFDDGKDKSIKMAKRMMNSVMKLYLSAEIIEQNEYVQMKQKVEEMQLSTLFNQMAQMEHSIEMLMRTIESGELTPRMFEVLAGLQKTMLEINKHATLHMMAAEEGMKKLKHDIDIYSDNTTIVKKKEEDGITARGNRDLMRDIQAEIQDVEFNEEDNE
tara:strand:+ start:554 stop:1156 length:603 start_codon:yes stop_codon:yes gene_type:complete